MSVIAGVCYGINFTPVIYIKDNYSDENGEKVSQNGKNSFITTRLLRSMTLMRSFRSGLHIFSLLWNFIYKQRLSPHLPRVHAEQA